MRWPRRLRRVAWLTPRGRRSVPAPEPWWGWPVPSEPGLVLSPGGWSPPSGVLPAWNWLPPEGAGARLDLVPLWVRAWYRLPFIDRYAHAWMWQRGAWEVRPPDVELGHIGGHGLTVSGGQQRIISASECPGRRPRTMRRRRSGARLFRALKVTVDWAYGRLEISRRADAKPGKATRVAMASATRPTTTRRRACTAATTEGIRDTSTISTPTATSTRATVGPGSRSSSSGAWTAIVPGRAASSGTARLSRPARAATSAPWNTTRTVKATTETQPGPTRSKSGLPRRNGSSRVPATTSSRAPKARPPARPAGNQRRSSR